MVRIEEAEGDVPITSDQERWAEALAVMKRHKEAAGAFIRQRIAALTQDDDQRGIARWREIERRVVAISKAEQRRHRSHRPALTDLLTSG